MSTHRWISVAMLALAAIAGVGIVLQRQLLAVSQQEIALLRDENRQLTRLRTENQQLKATLAPAAELERLRADRAAVVRLRAEIEEMKARAGKRSQ